MDYNMFNDFNQCHQDFMTGVRLTFAVIVGFLAINSIFGWWLDPSISELKKTVDVLEQENALLREEMEKLDEAHENEIKELRKEIETLEEDSVSVSEKLVKITETLNVVLSDPKLGKISDSIETYLSEEKKTA